jgi:hypothetical protein
MRRGSERVASGLIVSEKDGAEWVVSVKGGPTTEGKEERASDD